MLAPGKTLGGFTLLCPIADGGMAHLWAARKATGASAGTLVAFKVIHSRFADNATFRAMFLDEARIVSSIRHPQVAQVYELGDSADLLYLALEYVDGDSLFELIAPERTVPLPVALRITADVCAGLHAVHALTDESGRSRQVVHRDVSPPNILLGRGGAVKLIDFGIAHARGRAVATTDEGSVKGTVRYMAPEQARREALGPYTDVFGAGATLFRMLSGRAPYAAKSEVDTMEALLAQAPPTATLPSDVPAAVASIVHRAIAPRAADRFATADELRRALEGALAYFPAPDVAGWFEANLGAAARERRQRIAAALTGGPPETAVMAPIARRPPPSGGEPPPPGMMDVGALVARQREGRPAGGAPPPTAPPPAAADASARPEAPRPVGPSHAAAPAPEAGFGRSLRIAIGAILVVAIVAGVLFALPTFVKDAAIGAAREVGVTMTVERVGVGIGGATLRGVKLTAARNPAITATVEEIAIRGLSKRDVAVSGLDARLDGPDKELSIELAALLADVRAKAGGTPNEPRRFGLTSGKLTWRNVRGPGSSLSASDLGLDLESRGPGIEEGRGKLGGLVYEGAAEPAPMKLGPWAVSFDVAPATTRARLLFDPPVSDGPSALLVLSKTLPTELTINVPRSGFANLGVRPEDFGVPLAPGADIEVKATAKPTADGKTEVKGELSLWGLKPRGFARPVDLRVEGGLAGAPDQPMDLTKTIVTVGPFSAGLTGTVTPRPGAFHLDAMFKTLPLTCERLAQLEAKAHSPTAAALQALGQATGIVRVTGSVNASGVVKFDSAEPDQASLTWVAKETCGVSIFGM